MKVSDFVVSALIEYGVTDAFGIPGGVILPFLYALEESTIEPHLTYHEQTAGFAACGYAQASGELAVAYATRGPGISNMFTAIAEAYQESIPVLFITAHGNRAKIDGQRFGVNQEFDIVASVRQITKYAANIDDLDQVNVAVYKAIEEATSGRKGPVLLDFLASLWNREANITVSVQPSKDVADCMEILKDIKKHIEEAKRPVILIGDGLRYAVTKNELKKISENLKIPVLSSRGSQDLLSGSRYYYGYVGSHGIRYSNFILSKADLIVSIGNRLAFPHNSPSFEPILRAPTIIRIDVDEGELANTIPGAVSYKVDAGSLLDELADVVDSTECKDSWIGVCDQLKEELNEEDCTEPVHQISGFLLQEDAHTYVCDVGNNEFWFSRAYEKAGCDNQVLVSKSFGTLGSAIGKAIGAYYATKDNVICVVGDQGFQYNIQELQYLVSHNLPIKVLLINNECSRMIEDHEMGKFGGKLIHVTKESGYHVPNFSEIAKAYGAEDLITEIKVNPDIALTPTLPKGRMCQDMDPALDREKYDRLNKL